MSLIPAQTSHQWNYYYILIITNLSLTWHAAWVGGEVDVIATVLYSIYTVGNITIAFMIEPPAIGNPNET